MQIQSVGSPLLWAGFGLLIILMMAIDLGLLNRKAHEIRLREALIWTCICCIYNDYIQTKKSALVRSTLASALFFHLYFLSAGISIVLCSLLIFIYK